jgi:hypothetical protein
VSRAYFFRLFFLHAELQDPQIEKQAKNNTKTGQSVKHVLKQQTEVQFVVGFRVPFTCVGGHSNTAFNNRTRFGADRAEIRPIGTITWRALPSSSNPSGHSA